MNVKKKKILFLANASSSTIQAQDRDALNWAKFMNTSKYEITFYCKSEPAEDIF